MMSTGLMYGVVIIGGLAMVAVAACVYGVLCHKPEETAHNEAESPSGTV